MATTCQICARPILAKKGTIAHHGYKRPGQGWQTSSCYGAKYRPYEVACDAIEGAIQSCEAFIARTELLIAEYPTNPPAQFEELDCYKRVRLTVLRPEGFNPAAKKPSSYSAGSADHYAVRFHQQLSAWRQAVNDAEADIRFLDARLARWVAPSLETA